MKKLIIALILQVFLTSTALAALNGELFLVGLVQTQFSILVNDTSSASALDIVGGEAGTVIAQVTEISNNPTGYVVTLVSENGGSLVHDTDVTSTVTYTITYNGGTSFQPLTTATTVKTVGNLSSAVSPNNAVTISFTGDANALAGSYSDRLTFEIAAP